MGAEGDELGEGGVWDLDEVSVGVRGKLEWDWHDGCGCRVMLRLDGLMVSGWAEGGITGWLLALRRARDTAYTGCAGIVSVLQPFKAWMLVTCWIGCDVTQGRYFVRL